MGRLRLEWTGSIAPDDSASLRVRRRSGEILDDGQLSQACREMGMRLQAASDQHAAMTEDLEQLAATDSGEFTAEQIWVLIRAIKVQSQILQLYVGQPHVGA